MIPRSKPLSAPAKLLGKEDAVYMPTGTMTNQVGIRAHTEAGDAVLFDQNAHIYILEGGAPSAFFWGAAASAAGRSRHLHAGGEGRGRPGRPSH
jgi:threonine aldolase